MTYHDYIIIGAGPGGLQMGYFLGKANRDYLILEANDRAGSLFATQPRHRTLISINKRFNWFTEPDFNFRHDWNSLITDDYSFSFQDYSDQLYPHADDMHRYLVDFAKKFSINILYNTRVKLIDREQDDTNRFILTDVTGAQYSCRCLLMATGPVKSHVPDIEGIELAEGYETLDINPKRYENKRVAIIGRGNSAFEVANHIAGHAAIINMMLGNQLVKHAWQTHFVGDLRAINNTILDMYQLKSLHATLAYSVRKIVKREDGTFAVHWESDVPHWDPPGTIQRMYVFDHVIYCTGWKFVEPTLFAPRIAPKVDEKQKYPVLNSIWESSVPDMFYIGTVMGARDRRSTSALVHGYRHNINTLFHLLEERYYDVPLPSHQFELKTLDDLKTVAEFIIRRVSMSSGLYHLFELLSDVLVLSPGKAEIFCELPLEYTRETAKFTSENNVVTISLEYGFHRYPESANPLDFVHPAPGADCAAFLHPVLRHYVMGEMVSETNLDEALSVRHDPAAFDPAEESDKPAISLNIIMNFINKIAKITDEPLSLAQENSTSEHKGFIPWSPDDPRIQAHNIAPCTAKGLWHAKV